MSMTCARYHTIEDDFKRLQEEHKALTERHRRLYDQFQHVLSDNISLVGRVNQLKVRCHAFLYSSRS